MNKSGIVLKIFLIGNNTEQIFQVSSLAGDVKLPSNDPIRNSEGISPNILQFETEKLIVRIVLFPCSAEPKFKNRRNSWFQIGSGCLILFDKSDRESFDAISDWLNQFRSATPSYIRDPPPVVGILGVETDAKEFVSSAEAEELARGLNLFYSEADLSQIRLQRVIKEFTNIILHQREKKCV